jgi:hypothetical protein
METKPAVPVETKPKIPTFRQWVETETGLVHSLVDILDRELEAFWFAYLEQFFGNSRQQKLAGIKEWGQYRSNPTSPRWVYPLQHLDGFSKTLISSNARNAVVRNTPLVRIYHVNGGVVSFLTFIEFLSKEGQDIESIAELKPNHLASLWMLYVSFLEEKNPGYRDLFQQFFDPPRCSLVQSFLNKCTNACLHIKFILGIYEDGYAKIRLIQWDHRLPEDPAVISKQLSTWCDANSTDEVLLHAVVKIRCYAPYLDQDDTLPDRFYEAKEGVCYRVYRAPRHLYLMQRHADAAAEGKKT